MRNIIIKSFLVALFMGLACQDTNAQIQLDIEDAVTIPNQVEYPYNQDIKPDGNKYLEQEKKKADLIDRQNRVVEDLLDDEYLDFYNMDAAYDY